MQNKEKGKNKCLTQDICSTSWRANKTLNQWCSINVKPKRQMQKVLKIHKKSTEHFCIKSYCMRHGENCQTWQQLEEFTSLHNLCAASLEDGWYPLKSKLYLKYFYNWWLHVKANTYKGLNLNKNCQSGHDRCRQGFLHKHKKLSTLIGCKMMWKLNFCFISLIVQEVNYNLI